MNMVYAVCFLVKNNIGSDGSCPFAYCIVSDNGVDVVTDLFSYEIDPLRIIYV